MTVRWTEIAVNDLKRISVYIERESSLATANRVCRVIYDSVQRLRAFPLSGRQGQEPGTRELVVPELQNYVVVYRLMDRNGVELLRIWHGAQDRSAPVLPSSSLH